MGHTQQQDRPPAVVLEDLAGTIQSLVTHPGPFPTEPLLAAARYAAGVADTLKWRDVVLDSPLHEAGDVALGRQLLRVLPPGIATRSDELLMAQSDAAVALVRACLDLLDDGDPQVALLVPSARIHEVVRVAAAWQPPAVAPVATVEAAAVSA